MNLELLRLREGPMQREKRCDWRGPRRLRAVRLPLRLDVELGRQAEREGVPVADYLVRLLAERLGVSEERRPQA